MAKKKRVIQVYDCSVYATGLCSDIKRIDSRVVMPADIDLSEIDWPDDAPRQKVDLGAGGLPTWGFTCVVLEEVK